MCEVIPVNVDLKLHSTKALKLNKEEFSASANCSTFPLLLIINVTTDD